jgi:hypothetical protein
VEIVPDENVSATLAIGVPAADVFAVLADPTTHPAIDGTGWVRDALDREPLTGSGQVFRMAMYHPNAPGGHYRTANEVQVLDAPHAIGWRSGSENAAGDLEFGGWAWRYDLVPLGPSETRVTLTYDWSAVPQPLREHLPFPLPPFPPEHLTNSLDHLAGILVSRTA